MASAQVLSNPAAAAKKKVLLEAGKRRENCGIRSHIQGDCSEYRLKGQHLLEEFRKKKAAGQPRRAAPANQLQPANVEPAPHVLDNQHVRVTDSSTAGTSNGVSEAIAGDENRSAEFPAGTIVGSNAAPANPPMPTSYNNIFQVESTQLPTNDRESDRPSSPYLAGTGIMNYSSASKEKNNLGISTGALRSQFDRTSTDDSSATRPQMMWGIDSYSSKSSQFGVVEEAYARKSDSHVKDFPVVSHSENSRSSSLQNKFGYSGTQASSFIPSIHEDSVDPHTRTTKSSHDLGKDSHSFVRNDYTTTFNKGEMDLSNSVSHFPSGNSTLPWPSDSGSTKFSFDSKNSSNHVPGYSASTESNTRRSRPSFLDSINVPRAPLVDQGRVDFSSSEVHGRQMAESTASDRLVTPYTSEVNASESPMVSSISSGNGDGLYMHSSHENIMERKQDQYLHKQDENFAALEQHIEDLTQEKFSLQRTLEASRALAESLAAENSSLTDSYNQQGSLVNQLKSDMEKLQEEIKAQLVELEYVKTEFANAQLECSAADERSKLLASEVIESEEKALRLRSSELKLERQLENAQTEISSLRKKISSLERERQDLHSTIDALQEEKKLLQAKLRKSSANGKFVDVSKKPSDKKDMSTSTEDLIDEEDTGIAADSSNLGIQSTVGLLGSDASSSSLLPGNTQFNLDVSSLNIPHDQMRMIQNINTLISELALEKEEMAKLLLVETSETSKLKELNKELSRKLEVQTQRLELLTAQNMASGSITTRPPEARSIQENTPYADEGDEVVERVLGWIMKLFPGGPSRRRPSKLL